jgi:5'-3' exonuclease
MKVHLLDGTYELFRHYFAVPSTSDTEGNEVGAVRGVLGSVMGMLAEGVTHLGVATDHVVESFRNDLWPGYKTGEGIEPELLRQFHPLEDALGALGVHVWPTVELEADDALASAAHVAAADPRVKQVVICTPDKDLSQCIVGDHVVQLDRRANRIRNEAGVEEKFGVKPSSIPDYLALVGDSADGFPGLPGWGAKTTGRVLARYRRLEEIPRSGKEWGVPVRGSERLATTLGELWEDALLFRELATLRIDPSLLGSVEDLRWRGPAPGFATACERLRMPALAVRAEHLASQRTSPPSDG